MVASRQYAEKQAQNLIQSQCWLGPLPWAKGPSHLSSHVWLQFLRVERSSESGFLLASIVSPGWIWRILTLPDHHSEDDMGSSYTYSPNIYPNFSLPTHTHTHSTVLQPPAACPSSAIKTQHIPECGCENG